MTEVGKVASVPVYCQDCYNHLLVEGAADVTLDVALMHFLWWGRHMDGLSEHVEQRVTD